MLKVNVGLYNMKLDIVILWHAWASYMCVYSYGLFFLYDFSFHLQNRCKAVDETVLVLGELLRFLFSVHCIECQDEILFSK